MNFKGTTNIPREEMKGIVERFGGMWNGYTWIDQTTYLETAGRDALDQMLFLEAERMVERSLRPGRMRVRAHRHHLRAAGRRERSRAAARFRGHGDRVQGASLPPSDDRLARRSAVDERATNCTATIGASTYPTTRRWSSSATSSPTTCFDGWSAISGIFRRDLSLRADDAAEPPAAR